MRLWIILLFQLFDYSAGRRSLFGWRWRKWQGFMRMRKKYAACEVTDPSLSELQRCGKDGISKHECEHERFCCFKDGACFYPTQVMPPQNLRAHALSEHKIELAWNSYSVPYQFELEVIDITNRGGAKVPLQYVAGTQEYTSIGHLHGCHTFRLTLTALDGDGHRQVTKSTFGKTKCSLSSMRPADKKCDFECRDGHFCVTTDNICDGVADCIDGSDELEAMCKVSIIKTTTTESPLSSNAKSTPLNAAQQSESNSDKSYATFLKNFVSEIFTTAHSAPQKMHKIAAHDEEPPKVFNKQEIKSVICDFVAQNCAREDVLFRTLRQDCPESCSGSFFSWKSENANSSPSLLNGVTEEQLSRLRRYLEEIVNEPDDEMPGCLDKDDCALVIFPAELDVQFSAAQFTQEDGLAFREAISSGGGLAPIEAHGTNNAHVSLMDNYISMQELGPDSTIVLKPQVSRDSTLERSDKLVPVKNDENRKATENLHVKEVPILTSQKGGVMASDDDNQLAAYQQVSTWQQQQRQLDDNETGHQVSDQQDKQQLENFESTRSVNAVDPNRSLSDEVLSAADSVRIENTEVHNLKRQISTDNLQKGGYDKSASGIGGEKDGTSETDARISNVFQPEIMLKMATENEKLQNEILGSYLMSNSKSPRIATNNQERFSGVIGKARGDEIPAESLSGSTKTGSYEQTIIRSPTAKPISLQDWLILSGLIHELDYSDTSQSGVLDSYALARTSWSEEEAPPGGEKHAAKKLNKSPTRGSGTFPEKTSQPEVLNNHRDRVAKGDFLTNDDIHLLNEAIREYVSSTSSSKPKTMEAETYLKPLNELKAFLFTQNGHLSQNDTSSSSASFQEIHQNNSSEIRSSSDIKDELIINQNAPFTGDQTPQTSKNQNTKFSGAKTPKTQIVSIGRFSEIEAEKQSALESNWQNKEHSIEQSKSNDLLSATESISENVGIDQIKSISSSHVANGESFQNDGLIGGNQSSQKDVLKSENKLTSSGVLQTKTDVISSDWEHPVSQQAREPIEIPAQQNDFGGEQLGQERSQVSSEDELLDLSRSSSQSESTHGLLELESLDEARIVDISGSAMLADAGDETAASKQPVSQEQELFKAVPGHVSHVQQHSLSSISSEIDRTLNKENDVNALAENNTYSHSAANKILPKEESKPKLSISGSNDSPSSAGAAKQEERKSAKSDSELVENLTSDGKSGAYASAKYDIEILNDLRLPELLDALRTGGAYSVINQETAKGQDSSSATAKSDIPSSSSSKIAPSASVLNPLKEHTSKIQENHADKRTPQLIEARNDPESLQLNNPERQNSESKYEEQSTSNLLSLGAEQAPQHATMMSTSVNIPRVEDEYEHPLSSQTDGGVQNRVVGTQPVELNTLSSNNILEPIEQAMNTTSEAENSVLKLPNSPSPQSENLKNRHLEESTSNKNPSVGEKSDDFTVFVTENPAIEPVTESFRASATRESNLNQAGSAFAGSSKQNVVDLAQFKPDDIIADDIPPNTVASYQVNLGQTDSSNSWQQIPSVDRQSLIGINRLGGDLGSSVSPVYFAESSIENSAAVETAAVTGNSPNAASHASSIRDDPPQPSVADKLSSNSDSFAAADAESTSAKSQNDKLTSTTGSQTTIQLTHRDTVSRATVIRADEKEAYKGSASTSITDSERSQNRQVNKAAAERTQGENPVTLIQMNENWIDSSNPQITYQAARSDPPMHVTQNVQSAVDPNQIDYARDFENHDFNTVSNAKLSNQGFPTISDSENIYSKTPEAPNQKTTHNKDSQFRAKQAEKALGDERGIEREETVIDEMRASLSASSDTIISENYPQKPKTAASPLVHNVNGGFKDDGNPASGVKTPFQIFPDELVASGLPSSSAENLGAQKEAQRENNRPSSSAPDKLAESFSRDVFGAQVAKSSQSSQVTSALFCQSLGICNKENRIEAPAGDNKSQRQSGMRPWSGIDDCTPQCSVVGGKTICSYRKKCMTKSVDLPSLILADVLLNLLRND